MYPDFVTCQSCCPFYPYRGACQERVSLCFGCERTTIIRYCFEIYCIRKMVLVKSTSTDTSKQNLDAFLITPVPSHCAGPPANHLTVESWSRFILSISCQPKPSAWNHDVDPGVGSVVGVVELPSACRSSKKDCKRGRLLRSDHASCPWTQGHYLINGLVFVSREEGNQVSREVLSLVLS